jgi:hypothetical protein
MRLPAPKKPASVRERMGASTAVKLLIGWRFHFR